MARLKSVPVDVVRDHLAPFVDAGWSYHVVAEAAGVSRGTVVNVMRRNRPTVKAGTAAELLALTWGDLVKHQHAGVKVPSVGTRRRLEALIWGGWNLNYLAGHADIHRSVLQRALYGLRPNVTTQTAQVVDALFRELWDKTPPAGDWRAARAAKQARNRAKKRGYAPAAAWDQIDDPNETPNLGDEDGRAGVRVDDVEWLVRYERHTWDTLADRFGIQPGGLRQALHRAGRHDLMRRITETSQEAAA